MCGEKPSQADALVLPIGSPPRVRGKGRDQGRQTAPGGITPACAGKSFFMALRHRTGRDHPRVCGEKDMSSLKASSMIGSPPRVRGKASWTQVQDRPWQDHPRVCGEKHAYRSSGSCAWGSPPRVRGKVVMYRDRRSIYGITPACAGKSVSRGTPRKCHWDHPRVCGEKDGETFDITPAQGSPPRVRGKGQRCVLLAPITGITPACAGKRWIQSSRCIECRDHPRVCGEKCKNRMILFRVVGSPPRVRGKVHLFSMVFVELGITPACAGKRLKKALKNKDF